MKRLIWLPLAGFLLIAGAAVAAAAPGVADGAAALLEDFRGSITAAPSTDPSDDPDTEMRSGIGLHVGGESLLDEVLAELVTSGVITQEQSDAISQALTDRAEERRAEIEAERERLQQMWTQIQGFLDDDVITSDEIAQLPEDNPFSNLESILADGQVTREELQSVAPFGGLLFKGPGAFGPGGPGRHERWFFGPNDEPSTDSNNDTDSDDDTDSNSDASSNS